MLKKALVTGASGFIGNHLARKLLRGGWETHVLLRPESRRDVLAGIADQLVVHQHDGSTAGLVKIVKISAPQVIFHTASLFLAHHEPSDVEPLIRSNLLFSSQLVEAASLNEVRYLINTGTSWQHYENSEYHPVCLYAATKEAFEAILTYYTEAKGLKAITLKLFDTYGPGDVRRKLFTLLRDSALSQQPLLMSGGEQLIDLVYINDVVDAYLHAADLIQRDSANRHAAYAVSSGSPLKLRDLVSEYCRITGNKVEVKWGARPYRPKEVMVPWCTGVVIPGWSPKVNLEEGLLKMGQELWSDSNGSMGVPN